MLQLLSMSKLSKFPHFGGKYHTQLHIFSHGGVSPTFDLWDTSFGRIYYRFARLCKFFDTSDGRTSTIVYGKTFYEIDDRLFGILNESASYKLYNCSQKMWKVSIKYGTKFIIHSQFLSFSWIKASISKCLRKLQNANLELESHINRIDSQTARYCDADTELLTWRWWIQSFMSPHGSHTNDIR